MTSLQSSRVKELNELIAKSGKLKATILERERLVKWLRRILKSFHSPTTN